MFNITCLSAFVAKCKRVCYPYSDCSGLWPYYVLPSSHLWKVIELHTQMSQRGL